MKKLLNFPRNILAHSINILIAIPFVFVGLLVRSFAEWLIADPVTKPVTTSVTPDEDLEDSIKFLEALIEQREAHLKKIEESEVHDLTHLSEEELAEYFENEDDDNTNIH